MIFVSSDIFFAIQCVKIFCLGHTCVIVHYFRTQLFKICVFPFFSPSFIIFNMSAKLQKIHSMTFSDSWNQIRTDRKNVGPDLGTHSLKV